MIRLRSSWHLRHLLSTLICCLLAQPLRAANPITNLAFTADPSAHVFGDRLYVYPSHDRNEAKEFDMTDYHIYSTDDLQNWQDHGVVLDLANVPWALKYLWAPDCADKNGTYYLYFPAFSKTAGRGACVGVATGSSPAGPFKALDQPIDGVTGIDPAVFVDDDGQAYLYWAGAGPQGAQLKANMTELDGPAVKLAGIEHFFEGPWIFKRHGIYYYTYAAKMKGGTGDGGQGQWFDYATSDRPLGPFTYRGHFSHSGPNGGNIHGSQIEWHDKWYGFYHEFSTCGGDSKHNFKRNMRVDEMQFGPDDSIQELHWTDEGPSALKNFDPYKVCAAACLNASDIPLSPHAVTTEPCAEGGVDLCNIRDGGWVRYANVNFGSGAAGFTARVGSAKDGGSIELHLDRLDGPLVGTCAVPDTGGGQTWRDASCRVKGAGGVHALYLKFIGGSNDDTEGLFHFSRFQFVR